MQRPTREEITRRVAQAHGLKLSDLKGPRIDRRVACPRQEAMHEMALAGNTAGEIGMFLGRDPKTVRHGIAAHARRLAEAAAPQREAA